MWLGNEKAKYALICTKYLKNIDFSDNLKKTIFLYWDVIFSICKKLKSSVFCGENFRKTTKIIFYNLGGSNKPKLSKISYLIPKTELWTPENPFFPPWTYYKLGVPGTAIQKPPFWHMTHAWTQKFLLLSF